VSLARFLAVAIVAGTATGLSVGLVHLERDTKVGPSPIEPQLAGAAPAASSSEPQSSADLNAPYDGLYHFLRIRYSSGGRGFGRRGGSMWAHDYPRAERNFLSIMKETTFVPALTDGSNVLTLDDPELFKFPIAYIVEVGYWNPSDAEVESLGAYLQKGGFLIVDDFRDPWTLNNLEVQLRRVLPDANMVMVDETHAIFDSFFRVIPQDVIPPYGRGDPVWYGIYEDNDPTKRLMVIINYNNDIAEYWEYSDYGYYSIELSNEAYKLGVNYVVYGLTH
jgi:hypothetical protein